MKKGYVVIEVEAINSDKCGTAVYSTVCHSRVYFDKKKAKDVRDQCILDKKDYFVSVWENDEEETVPGSYKEWEEYKNVYFEDDEDDDGRLILYVTVNDEDEYTYFFTIEEIDIEE